MKKVFVVFLATILLTGAGSDNVGVAWRKVDVLYEEKAIKSGIHGISVSFCDEVAIDFYDGTVYLYDVNGNFLMGYKFPPFHPEPYAVFFDKNSNRLCHYALKGNEAYAYDTKGVLCETFIIESQNEDEYLSQDTDTHGTRYKKEHGNIIKIYPSGSTEIFLTGYKKPMNNIIFLPVLSLIVCVTYAYMKKINNKKNL